MNYRRFELKHGQEFGRLSCSQVKHKTLTWCSIVPSTVDTSIDIFTDIAAERKKNSLGIRLVGLGVWFSLRVREVPGSNPGWALLQILEQAQTGRSWATGRNANCHLLGAGQGWLNGFGHGLQIYFDMHLLVQRRTTFIILDKLKNVGAILTATNNDNDSNVIHLKWHPAPKTNEFLLLCIGRESNPGQLLGRQLCSPLYHQCNVQVISNMETSTHILTVIFVESDHSLTKRIVGLGVWLWLRLREVPG